MLKFILFGIGFVLLFEGLVYFFFANKIKNIFQIIKYREEKVSISQNIWAAQNSGLSWGIPASDPKAWFIQTTKAMHKAKQKFFIVKFYLLKCK